LGASNGTHATTTQQAADDRLLLDVIRRTGPWLVPLVVLAGVGAAATVVLPALLGRAIDQMAAAHADDGDWSVAHATLVATVALLVFVGAVEVVSRLVVGLGTAQAGGLLRRRLSRHMLGVGPALTRHIPEGDLVTRLVTSTGTAAQVVAVVSGLAVAVIPPVGGVVALGVMDPWLAVTFGVGMVSISGAVRLYLRDARVATAGYLRAQGSVAARLVDALAGARTIAAARTTEREIDRVLVPLAALRRHGDAVWRTMARMAFKGEPVVLLTQVAVVAVAGIGVSAGRLSPGEMMASSRYAVMAGAIGGLLDELAGLTRSRAAAQRVGEVLRQPVVKYGNLSLPAGGGRLELRGVTAGPPGSPVLSGLDLTVPGGRVTALVGQSGAGKSWTAALAGRLCDPDEGEVTLDGVPLDQVDRRSLRRAVAYAFERPALLGGTIAGSIGFGVDRLPPEGIREAASAARADRFIRRLPAGYEASLRDTPLSGGELQRIGLARALAPAARLLILDDATSSLDTATEAEITAALTASTRDQTRLIVTHRAATAGRADQVAWLDAGRIRACGPHRDLWDDPDYRAIFRPDAVSAPVVPAAAALGSGTGPDAP
jgi:ATP-binding cassette subfamily B protein